MAEKSSLTTNAKDYKLIRLIGKGCDGTASIHLAKHLPSGRHVAVKIFHLDLVDQNGMQFGIVQHELLMSRQLQHENLMGSLCTFTAEQQIWSIMPVHGYGSCKDLLCAHFSLGLPEASIANLLYDVVKALEYLHSRGVIHRSVKASHILISSEGHVSLSGLRHGYSLLKGGSLDTRAFDYPDHYLTALLWAAPEILQQNLSGYTTSSDVYSLGITACELANGAVPFADVVTSQMLLDKLRGVTPNLWDSTTIQEDPSQAEENEEDPMLPYTTRTFSQHFHDFIEECLRIEPQSRPSCSELLHHNFFKSVRKRVKSELNIASPLPELLHPVQPVMDILKQLGENASNPSEEMSNVAESMDTITIDAWDF